MTILVDTLTIPSGTSTFSTPDPMAIEAMIFIGEKHWSISNGSDTSLNPSCSVGLGFCDKDLNQYYVSRAANFVVYPGTTYGFCTAYLGQHSASGKSFGLWKSSESAATSPTYKLYGDAGALYGELSVTEVSYDTITIVSDMDITLTVAYIGGCSAKVVEWDTRLSSGNISVTCGFEPKALFNIASWDWVNGSAEPRWEVSTGFWGGATGPGSNHSRSSAYVSYSATGWAESYSYGPNRLCATETIYVDATSSTGLTLYQNGCATGIAHTCAALIIGGEGIQANAKAFWPPSGDVPSQTVTGVGFAPNCALLHTALSGPIHMSHGFVGSDASGQGSVGMCHQRSDADANTFISRSSQATAYNLYTVQDRTPGDLMFQVTEWTNDGCVINYDIDGDGHRENPTLDAIHQALFLGLLDAVDANGPLPILGVG